MHNNPIIHSSIYWAPTVWPRHSGGQWRDKRRQNWVCPLMHLQQGFSEWSALFEMKRGQCLWNHLWAHLFRARWARIKGSSYFCLAVYRSLILSSLGTRGSSMWGQLSLGNEWRCLAFPNPGSPVTFLYKIMAVPKELFSIASAFHKVSSFCAGAQNPLKTLENWKLNQVARGLTPFPSQWHPSLYDTISASQVSLGRLQYSWKSWQQWLLFCLPWALILWYTFPRWVYGKCTLVEWKTVAAEQMARILWHIKKNADCQDMETT